MRVSHERRRELASGQNLIFGPTGEAKELNALLADMDELEDRLRELRDQMLALAEDIVICRMVNLSLAHRCYVQSESLSQRAEKKSQ